MGKSIDGVEIFATGKHKDATFTEQHLDDMVKAFDAAGFIPPLKLGHDENQKILQRDGMPAAGWVKRIYRVGSKLVADFFDIPDKIAKIIEKGAYRQISSEVYFNIPLDGKVFSRALRAVALLGADNPAVTSLKPIDPLTLYTDINSDYIIADLDFDIKNYNIIDIPEKT